jgi:hypothetical protein
MMLSSLWIIFISTAIFVLPGYAVLALFNPESKFEFTDRICISIGLSIALVTLTLYGTTLLGIRQTTTMVSLLLTLAAGLSAWDLIKRHRLRELLNSRPQLLTLLLLSIIFTSAVIARIWGVEGIEFPLWTDSYHHTLISQIIVDSGLVPSSYEPYAPIRDFSYHFGFHTLVAWFHWLTRIPVPRSVVLVGQIVNAMIVPTTYVLAKRLWKSSVAGLAAGLIIGLLSHMPAFFVNWGRYTQLTGQMLVIITLALTIELFRSDHIRPRLIILTAISAAGLFLVHNRMTLFYGLYALSFFIIELWHSRQNMHKAKTMLVNFGLIAIIALIIDIQWLSQFLRSYGDVLTAQIANSPDRTIYGGYFNLKANYFLDYGIRIEWWFLGMFGVLIGLIKRDGPVFAFLLGTLFAFLGAITNYINVTPLYPPLVFVIWVHVPIALFCGYMIMVFYAWIDQSLPTREARGALYLAIISILLILSIVIGIPYIADLTLPKNGFVRPADVEAMAWIEDNANKDALFYIKPHFWIPYSAHGLDAGYWIPYLTGRETVIPPQIYGSDGSSEYIIFIYNRLKDLLAQRSPDDFWSTAQKYQVTHIYIGKRQTDLDPVFFLSDPEHFDVEYHEGGVWIFKLIQNPG